MITKKPHEIKQDAKTFVRKWTGLGKERQDDKTFWEDLLEDVFGIPKARNEIEVQKPVKFEGTTKALDVYVKSSQVVIEQKSYGIDLDKTEIQSDDTPLTPMQQAKRYYDWLDKPQQGRYIIACNFDEFRIFDSFHKAAAEKTIRLEELPDRWRVLRFAPPTLLAFPYIDGGLFHKDDRYATPAITEEIRQMLIEAWNLIIPETGEHFYWNDIVNRNANFWTYIIGNPPFQGSKKIIAKEPEAEKYFHPWYGSFEFIKTEKKE